MGLKASIISASDKAGKWFDKNSPVILLGIGITGLLVTSALAVKATPKAMKVVEDANKKLDKVKEKQEEPDISSTELAEIKKEKRAVYLDTAKDLGILYGPAAALAVSSTLCLIKSHKIEHNRLTAVTTAYQISEAARKEYKDKVVEMLGQRKEQDIRDAISADKIKKNPPDKDSDVYKDTRDTLCLDALSGRYFRSNANKAQQAVNRLNKQLTSGYQSYVLLNDFYDEVGLEPNRMGSMLGWNCDELVELSLTSALTDDEMPCLVIDFMKAPTYDYRNSYY